MKYILVSGASHAGKSTTMDAVCKMLKPDRIQRLNPDTKTLEDIGGVHHMLNGSFLLEVNGSIILVAAGATTEQKITITLLVKIAIELKLRIDFAIVSMRSYEKKTGFNTPEELKSLGECIGSFTVNKISGEDFKNSQQWKARVQGIVNLLAKHGAMSGELV
jgi:hypothetical protein